MCWLIVGINLIGTSKDNESVFEPAMNSSVWVLKVLMFFWLIKKYCDKNTHNVLHVPTTILKKYF